MSITSAFRPTRRTAFLAGVAIVSSTCALSLAPDAAHAASSPGISQTVTASDPRIDTRFLAALQSVQSGESTTYAIDGVDLRIANVDGRLYVDDTSVNRGVCAVTVASGLVLLGAAALATIAFATAGAGGAIIAGYLMTTSQLWAAAGLLGAYGALLTWVEAHVCR